MLKLEVIHYKGAVPARPISAQFGAQGGTIGRGESNTMVLPDAERFISRTHARIKFQSGQYIVEDHGSSTPVMVNGRAVGKGSETGLAHGDELGIGEYQLRAIVELVVAPGAAPEGAGARPARAEDPLAMFGGATSTDPFADLIPKSSTATSVPPHVPSSALRLDPFGMPEPRTQAGIPADFDPFANLSQSLAPASPAAPLPGATGPGLGLSADTPSLDALFGLGKAASNDPLGGLGSPTGPLSGNALSGAPSLDPLDAFMAKPAPIAAKVQRNDVPELSGAYVPPKAIVPPEPVAPVVPVAFPEAVREPAPVLPGAAAKPPQTVTTEPAAASPAADPPVTDSDADALAATQRVGMVRPGADALVQAFLEGAGIDKFNLPAGLTPQTMNMLGQVLRETVQAMLDLLLARAMLKREMRADVTMIEAQENNPLKFSPNVEAALMHLLSPQRGYMQPLEAVKDACNDLRSNQFAFMAGMRAALAGILQRFNPDQLEHRLKNKTMLDSLLPANRKAKMWDLFSDLYGDVSKEAEDNFHEMFGREFVRAYEAQAAKLAGRDGGRS